MWEIWSEHQLWPMLIEDESYFISKWTTKGIGWTKPRSPRLCSVMRWTWKHCCHVLGHINNTYWYISKSILDSFNRLVLSCVTCNRHHIYFAVLQPVTPWQDCLSLQWRNYLGSFRNSLLNISCHNSRVRLCTSWPP